MWLHSGKIQDERKCLHSEFLFGLLLRTGFFHNKNPAYTETTFTVLYKVAHTAQTLKSLSSTRSQRLFIRLNAYRKVHKTRHRIRNANVYLNRNG